MSEVKHTPGPWRWEINRKHKSVQLCGGLPAGTFDKTVLSFERYGMKGAAPVFHNWTEDGWGGAPKRADELAVEKAGREHHADWFAVIDHPNAHLMAASPDLLGALKDFVSGYPEDVHYDKDSLVGRGRAAIAKAEGRS